VGNPVTVAIPVRNGGAVLGEVLTAVRSQRVDRPVQLLVADSGSTDGSQELARRHQADVFDVPPDDFSHGGTRNLLVRHAAGSHVAFLSQDAVPSDGLWLARLLEGFDVAENVGLVFGPYRARAGASLSVRRELEEWFASLPRQVTHGVPYPGDADEIRRGFFTDANGCVARAAWEKVPFRPVAYAEDQLLGRDMLAAGYAKVYVPDAAVIHSHEYRSFDQLRRTFDEWRGLLEVGAVARPTHPIEASLGVQRSVRDDVALARREGHAVPRLPLTAGASLRYHTLRAIGAALGSRADRLPARVRQACSLERRDSFEPVGEVIS
jgi:rhamnosyltransferase